MNSKLVEVSKGKVSKSAKPISQSQRRIPKLAEKFMQIGQDIRGAINHWHLVNSEKRDPINILRLAEDIKNVPYHIFGRHNLCKDYFTCSKAGTEPDLIDDVKDLGIFEGIVAAVKRPADLASSLIEKVNSNQVECFMGVVAKQLQGKRINPGGGVMYSMLVASAVVSFNKSGYVAADAYKLLSGRSPAMLMKKRQARLLKLRNRVRARKPRRRNLNFFFLKSQSGDKFYGANPMQPALEGQQLNLKIQKLRQKLNVDDTTREQIEINTRQQALSLDWFNERKCRISASNCKKVANMLDSTNNSGILKRLLYPEDNQLDNLEAIRWGREHEKDAIEAYENKMAYPPGLVQKCGLFISKENGILAASPDGCVNLDGIVEVKCPYSLRDSIPEDWVRVKNSPLVQLNDGTIQLSRKHDYYYQVVMQLHVTMRNWCDFIVWTPHGIFSDRIERNSETLKLWSRVLLKLDRFWEQDLAPELVDPIYPTTQTFRLPEYRQLAQASRNTKKKAI